MSLGHSQHDKWGRDPLTNLRIKKMIEMYHRSIGTGAYPSIGTVKEHFEFIFPCRRNVQPSVRPSGVEGGQGRLRVE